MNVVILICALAIAQDACSVDTATVVMQGPRVTDVARCGMIGQAYFASTPIAGYLEDGHYLKLLCPER